MIWWAIDRHVRGAFIPAASQAILGVNVTSSLGRGGLTHASGKPAAREVLRRRYAEPELDE